MVAAALLNPSEGAAQRCSARSRGSERAPPFACLKPTIRHVGARDLPPAYLLARLTVPSHALPTHAEELWPKASGDPSLAVDPAELARVLGANDELKFTRCGTGAAAGGGTR
jgi:hypothetical protein